MSKTFLVIGPKFYEKDPANTGGVAVLFEQFLSDLKYYQRDFEVIDSNIRNYKNGLHELLSVIVKILTKFRKYDHITLHGSPSHFLLFGPLVILLGKLFGKTVSLRKFAGNYHEYYEKYDPLRKKIVEFILKNSHMNFFETKFLVDYFKKFNEKTYWFPNVRRRAVKSHHDKKFEKKFVYISHIKQEKGMDELLEAFQMLDGSYSLDVYGPVHEEKYTQEYMEAFGVAYKGMLQPDKVMETLQSYDVLVLPSHREGYPGIIIESFSVGRPVLTTKLPSIKEIVVDEETGFLVEPENTLELSKAFAKFNEDNFALLSKNAYNAFEIFDAIENTKRYLEYIDGL